MMGSDPVGFKRIPPVGRGRNTVARFKYFAEISGIFEPAGVSDLIDRKMAVLEQFDRGFHADLVAQLREGRVEFLFKDAAEVIIADAGIIRNLFQGEFVAVIIILDAFDRAVEQFLLPADVVAPVDGHVQGVELIFNDVVRVLEQKVRDGG